MNRCTIYIFLVCLAGLSNAFKLQDAEEQELLDLLSDAVEDEPAVYKLNPMYRGLFDINPYVGAGAGRSKRVHGALRFHRRK